MVCADEATRRRFGVGPLEDRLGLYAETLDRLRELSEWHDGALDWYDPAAASGVCSASGTSPRSWLERHPPGALAQLYTSGLFLRMHGSSGRRRSRSCTR